MKRRHFLTSGVFTAGTVALSGCLEQELKEAESQPPLFDDVYDEEAVSLPVPQKFERAEKGVLQAEETTLEDPENLRAYLNEQDLLVETLRETVENGVDVLELAYVDERIVDRGLLYSLGRISGGYAALIAGGHAADKLKASVYDSEGKKFGAFEIATETAEKYIDGGLTAAEYAGAVADTAESDV